MDTHQCQPLFREIREFYERLNMKVYPEIPLILVDRQSIDPDPYNYTIGLCLTGGESVSSVLPWAGYEMTKEPESEVLAIIILYGLPRLQAGSVLAHEMMHAWMKLEGYRGLSSYVKEGICQVMAHTWLDSQIMSDSGKLGEFFIYKLETDPSPVYGDGFRAGNKAVINYGLRSTLEHIKNYGSFP